MTGKMDIDSGVRAYIGGLACRLPRSRNAEEFWENLSGRVDMTSPLHWPHGLYNLPDRIGAMLDVDRFDASFFNISDFEANSLNPMLRHLLEVVYECIADSGLALSDLQAAKTGFYLGCFGSDTDVLETSRCANMNHVSASPFLTGEVMRIFRLKGPVITVDTACSSSMAALNTAVNDLETDKCKYAIVAGSNLIIHPQFTQQMVVLNMLSPEGRSQVFDEAANGYVRAEGVAAILLTSFAEECRRVYAGIREIGINCDGYKSVGITNPSSERQAALMKTLYDIQDINVNDIKYVEAHGTGTQAGDTAETRGIAEVFCQHREQPLLIGSVKSNMGHSEATAALASIVKCILAMHYKEIPPNINFKTPNPKITALSDGRLKVVDKTVPLPGPLIGINSFGFGGVNGHVIMEKYTKENKEEFVQVQGHMLVPITARTQQGVEKIKEFVSNNRYNTSLLGLLSGSMLSCDRNQPIRAYIQIGPRTEDFHLSVGEKRDRLPSAYLWLEDFMWDKVAINKDLLEIADVQESLSVSAELIRLMDSSIDLMNILQNGQPLDPCTRQGMLLATAFMIAIFDLMEDLSMPLTGVIGCGLTEVVAAFFDGAITLHQCMSIISSVGGALEKFTKEHGDRWQVFDVKMPVEEMYRLGRFVQVLSIRDADHGIISVETKHKEKVLDKIHQKGGIYRLLPVHIPLYTGFLEDLLAPLKNELRDVIPSPKYRSCRTFSARCNWSPITTTDQILCDADYFSRILCTSVNQSAVLPQLSQDRLVLRLSAKSALPGQNLKRASHLGITMPGSPCLSQRKSQSTEGLAEESLKSRSATPEFLSRSDSGFQEKEQVLELQCMSSANALFSCIGDMHLMGYQMNLQQLYTISEHPLDCETPCLSPLVQWDHTQLWNIPHWSEFSARRKDELVIPYTLFEEDLEGIHTPVAMLLYHAWVAISQRLRDKKDHTEGLCPIRLYELVIPMDAEISNKMLPGTIIQVHPGRKHFIAVQDDVVLMKGKFEVSDDLRIPRMPGFDLDKNENVESPKAGEVLYEKTEVMWEDSWLDFINDVLEFANQATDAPLCEVLIKPQQHLKEAKDCANFLVVSQKYTGLCKAGGCVLQFFVTLTPPMKSREPAWKQMQKEELQKSCISKVMVYSLHGYKESSDRLLVYLADRDDQGESPAPVLGLMTITGERCWKEVPVPADWSEDDLEVLVPYILSAYILYDVAMVQEGQTVLILPPIDTVGVYLLSLASQAGGSVFTGTWDVENQDYLENIFPLVRVLQGDKLEQNIMLLTQGLGVDICIRCSGGDVDSAMKCASVNGIVIQGTTPPLLSSCSLEMFNRALKIIRPIQAFTDLMNKSTDDIQALLLNMQGEAISKLSTQGFPETKGLLYSLEDKSSFIQPLTLDRLISLLSDPGFGPSDPTLDLAGAEDLNEADAICVERIQNIVAPKPKDYSMAEASMISSRHKTDDLNFAMMTTPPVEERPEKVQKSNKLSPVIRIVDISELASSFGDKPEEKCPPTSTPMTNPSQEEKHSYHSNKQLEESYLDNQSSDKDICSVSTIQAEVEETGKMVARKGSLKHSGKTDSVKKMVTIEGEIGESKHGKDETVSLQKRNIPCITICEPEEYSPRHFPEPLRSRPATPGLPLLSFSKLMSKKSKPVPTQLKLTTSPRVDLLMLAPPITPMTPAVKDLLTPNKMMPTLVPLNPHTTAKGRPLFIVHPILGEVTLLEKLGANLDIPCFGIQRTLHTPSDTIENVASYYKNSIEMMQEREPYRVAGYSFGGMIAMEIALQLQTEGKEVEPLIMLDGSPSYVHAQIMKAIELLPKNATKAQIEEALEAGALVNWMSLFGPVLHKDLTYSMIRKLPTTEDKIDAAVDLSLGNMIVSQSEAKTKWLAVKEKVFQTLKKNQETDRMCNTAKEIIRLKRKEKATIFLNHAKMAKIYKTQRKFEGNVYLFRVKCGPIFASAEMDATYGLKEQCTGSVSIKYYNGHHESFLVKDDVQKLTNDLHTTLGVKVKQ